MNTKLTLSMDASTIERAKQAARARNIGVSALLAGLVRGLDALEHPRGPDFIGPLTQAARRALVMLRDVFDTVAPDQRILNQAIDPDIPDFEDAIQLFSPLHARADYLLTRNVGDCPAGILPILAPDEFLALLDRAVEES